MFSGTSELESIELVVLAQLQIHMCHINRPLDEVAIVHEIAFVEVRARHLDSDVYAHQRLDKVFQKDAADYRRFRRRLEFVSAVQFGAQATQWQVYILLC